MDIKKTVDSIMKRANQLAPNSNFKIDGFESVKFRNIVQALVEELTQAAPEVASVPDAGQAVDAILLSDMVDGAVHPNYGSGLFATANCVTTLYTRPQPAPAALSDEQIAAIYQEAPGIVSFARAVLAAANK